MARNDGPDAFPNRIQRLETALLALADLLKEIALDQEGVGFDHFMKIVQEIENDQ